MDSSIANLINALKNKSLAKDFHTNIVEVLKNIVSKPSLFSAVWHPVGFIHVNLAESIDANLRLHLWVPIPKEFRGLGWQIHDHTWRLTSYLICGSLTNYIYEVNLSSVDPTHRIYEVKYDGRINYLEATDSLITCKTTKEEVVNRGDLYFIEPKIFHSSDHKKDMIGATLVLSEKTQIKTPRVVGEIDGQKTYTMERYKCDELILKDEVSKVLQAI